MRGSIGRMASGKPMAYDICHEVEVSSRVNFWDDNGIQIRRLQLDAAIISHVCSGTMSFRSLTTSVKSSKARPLSTALMRTACSRIPAGRGWSRNWRRLVRASAFLAGVTESSRSYATQSTLSERDLSRNFFDELGTGRASIEGGSLGIAASLPYNNARRMIVVVMARQQEHPGRLESG